MLSTPPVAAPDLLKDNLQGFAEWRVSNLRGDEKGEAQVFLDRFFQSLGHGGVYEAGATLEYRLGNDNGGTSFADLLWKPRVLIEMKKTGTDLSRHFRQAFDYWIHSVPNRPRYVILCNFDDLWIYDFENQMDEPVEKVTLAELPDRWEALGFLLPAPIAPVFGNDLVAVTRDAAADVAKVFMSLKQRGVAVDVAQRFALQCVMAMFSEDVGLLPQHFFTTAINEAKTGAEAYDLIGGLFREMNTVGRTQGGRFAGTPYFNGGLFVEVVPQELSTDEIRLLREAASTKWSDVRPEIFGTLFEGSMDAGERHASGAHFTSQADIARVVGPVIVQPWQERIDAAKTIRDLTQVLESMSQYRVLDPSCGSGNFLYVAYRELRRLEREVLEKIRDRRRSDGLAGQAEFKYVNPEQFYGIDINPFAVEVAKVTMLLGKKLSDDELHEVGSTLPLDNLDSVIVAGDSLFVEWPQVDAIIGNPPYIGRRKMVRELGADYCARLDDRFGPQGVSDFVTYWFPKAHQNLPEGGRAGFVATNTIKQGDSRKASLDYLIDHNGVIIDAVAGMPWSGDAAVTVSIVNWQNGGQAPEQRVLWIDEGIEPLKLPTITAALSPEIDLRSARDLAANKGGVFQGQTLGMVDVFKIGRFEARQFQRRDQRSVAVIHPLLGGDELLKQTTGRDWVIDIPSRDSSDARQQFPEVMKYLEKEALPTRQGAADAENLRNAEALALNPKAKLNKHHSGFLDRWWTLVWRRDALTSVTSGLHRYIALTRVSSEQRGPVFSFVDAAFRLEDSAVAFPFSDDYSFGILQSVVHETWFRERCSTLETRLRYTSKSVFASFPWPQNPSQADVDSVSTAAMKLVEHTGKSFRLGYSLGQQYDVLRLPGHSKLRELQKELNDAVVAAYGFTANEDLLTQILELNLLVSQRESEVASVTGPGPQHTVVTGSSWCWPAPSIDL
ncbi:DNA methyltransferase [Cryobacterium sp. MDB2-10]|uniref:DNA methyltransferase n=1 Tax=Cryobacterium sp. MDB2-10 TaxID=1259177 RepID=UPI0010746092|nr:DNA methyltransferase [Cryobacterium sp. MDB2-10]TFC12517.1 class I SAM-dependent DNA methyltransferase [Cryobacterium sp. MDB2-10]